MQLDPPEMGAEHDHEVLAPRFECLSLEWHASIVSRSNGRVSVEPP